MEDVTYYYLMAFTRSLPAAILYVIVARYTLGAIMGWLGWLATWGVIAATAAIHSGIWFFGSSSLGVGATDPLTVWLVAPGLIAFLLVGLASLGSTSSGASDSTETVASHVHKEIPSPSEAAGGGKARVEAPSATWAPTEQMWAQALAEVEGLSRRPGLWARCFATHNGSEPEAKAMYMRERVAEMSAAPGQDATRADPKPLRMPEWEENASQAVEKDRPAS